MTVYLQQRIGFLSFILIMLIFFKCFAERILLMLQSLKRAHKVDPKNPKLHNCLIRFYLFIQKDQLKWDSSVEEVISKETKIFFENKDVYILNKEFMENNCNSLKAIYEGARVMYQLDNNNQSQALSLITNLGNKYKDIDIQVSFNFTVIN